MRFAAVCLAVVAGMGAVTVSPRAPNGRLAPVTTVAAAPAQVMEGFGASGAWWPNDLGAFPRSVQEEVARLLFSPAGIALSVYRYNIGGGGSGVTDPTRAPQTFLVRPGVYDWSRDPGGRAFLELARRHRVPILVGFVNSAPPAFTTNGESCGGALRPGAEDAYARYLTDVAAHFHADGITLSYLSPMNEPDNAFGGCGQEGMSVPVAQRARVVQALGAALAQRAAYARVIADESSTAFFQFLPEVPQWLAVDDTARWVAALAHHTYEFPTDDMLRAVAPLGPRFHKPTWMTEICCYNGRGPIIGFGAQYDPTMTSALWMADSIWQDFAITGDTAFHWWTAVSKQLGCDPVQDPACEARKNPSGWNDGLLYYDPHFHADGNHRVYTTKRFFVLGNFSRYVRPGAVRHEVSDPPLGVRLLAFSQGRSWTVVAINDAPAGHAPATLRLALPSRVGPTGAFETSATRDLARRAPARPDRDDTFTATLPAQSVTTLTFREH